MCPSNIVNVPTLILPGIGNSDHAHWQTLWEFANPEFIHVQQKDWHSPVCDEWGNGLEQTVANMGESPVLVAHSLGCLCVAHWAARTNLKIKGALLVAPPNPEDGGFPIEARGFSPLPLQSFGFPSIVVASSSDPFGSLEYARACASGWGSRFVNLGPAGHINLESGLGEWPEGWALLSRPEGLTNVVSPIFNGLWASLSVFYENRPLCLDTQTPQYT